MFEGHKLLYLSRADVEACALDPMDIIEAIDLAFGQKGRGLVELPPKPGIHPRSDGFIHAMPGFIAGTEDTPGAAGLKWVGGFSGNIAKGLPYISGLLILNDAETGLPMAVMDCTWITAWRTAAVSAVAARYLARPKAASLAICGAGVQGRTNLDCLALVMPNLSRVKVFDISPQALADYVDYNRPRHPNIEFQAADSARQAVEGAEVIVTAGLISQNPEPVIELDWLAPGSLSLPLDFDCYFRSSALTGCDLFLTDDVDQLLYYQSDMGHFPELPAIHGDLGQLAAGQIKGRTGDEQRIMVCNLGIAMDDMATAPLLVERARDRGLGVWLDL